VTDEDGNLTRIVGKYYQDDKKLALAAILLANPQITSENLIYAGQSLTLPEIDQSVICLADKKHYALYNQYADEARLKQAVEQLTKNQVRFVIQETQEPGGKKDYRIFIGAYEQEADLQKAKTIAEGD
jgi:SPOR domain